MIGQKNTHSSHSQSQSPAQGSSHLVSNDQIEHAAHRFVLARKINMNAGHQGEFHRHIWYQLMYASSGLLNVEFCDQVMVVPPQKAVWLPPDCLHRVSAPAGAKFRSLYFRPDKVAGLGTEHKVVSVPPLVRELILTVVAHCDHDREWQAQDRRLLQVLLDQLTLQPVSSLALLMPKDARLSKLVKAIQLDPSNNLSMQQWAEQLALSSRTLSRLFLADTGLGFQQWRQKIRLLHSLILLEQGVAITQVALEVGYQSPSAFTYAFQHAFHCTPTAYLHHKHIAEP